MARSRLPLEERIFISRRFPEAIVVGDGETIAGPFCVNCGNQQLVHRDNDDACPVRRLHPLLPQGAREKCNCTMHRGLDGRWGHDPDCNTVRYGFNGTVVR